MPMALAKISSNVMAKIWRRKMVKIEMIMIPNMMQRIKSWTETARMLPNKYELRSILMPGTTEIRKVPSASADADKTAIAASPLILEFCLMRKIKTAAIITIGMENSRGANPQTIAMAVAPKATCDRPSPIMDCLRRTRLEPISAAQIEIMRPTTKARTIKS